MTVTAFFGQGQKRTRKSGELVKRNAKTTWMRLDRKVIKRHNAKHGVDR